MIDLLNSDARRIPLADQSVQCIITSPPYWGLRDYGTATWQGGEQGCEHVAENRPQRGHNGHDFGDTRGDELSKTATKIQYRDACAKCGAIRIDAQIGLERVPDCLGWATGQPCGECYVCHIVAVMRECWRVLRDDGVMWLNLGDSYSSDTKGANNNGEGGSTLTSGARPHVRAAYNDGRGRTARKVDTCLKPKNLCMIPARVALSLQADGWYLRSDIIWNKPNPMPESVTDRPTKSHEYVFLLTKQERYYYDAEAIKENVGEPTRRAASFRNGGVYTRNRSFDNSASNEKDTHGDGEESLNGRNRRSVWTVATSPYSGAHFATFPPALVEPMILAGTSQRGACPTCGKAWARVVEHKGIPRNVFPSSTNRRPADSVNDAATANGGMSNGNSESLTIGWRPACACYGVPSLPGEPVCPMCQGDGKARINGEDVGDCLVCDGTGRGLQEQMDAYYAERARLLDLYATLPVVPCVVLDPFAGSGTVGKVAVKHGRRFVGCELNREYIDLAFERTSKVQTVMQL